MHNRPIVFKHDDSVVARKKRIAETQELLAPAYHYQFLADEKPTTSPSPCTQFRKLIGKACKAVIIGNSTACDTATVMLGILKNQRSLIGCIDNSPLNVGIVGGFYFAQSAAVNGPEIAQGMDDTAEIISTRGIPSEWEPLPLGAEISAGALSFFFAIYSAFAEGTASYFFLTDEELGVNNIVAIAQSVLYVLSSLTSESRTSWEKTRNFFLKSEPIGCKLSKLLSYPLGLFSGAGAIILGYDGIQSAFSIENTGMKWFIFLVGLTKGATDGSYSEKKNHEALEGVIDEICKGKCPSAFQVFAVSGSLFYGALVLDSLAVIYTDALATAALPFTMPAFLPPVLGYGIGLSQGVTATYGTFSFLNKLKDLVVYAFSNCRNRNKTNTEIDITEMADIERPIVIKQKTVATAEIKTEPNSEAVYVQPAKYYQQKNRNLQFAPGSGLKPPTLEIRVEPVQAFSMQPPTA